MTAQRMAVEIWAHVIIYYAGKPLAKHWKNFNNNIWSHANPITVNTGENRMWAFYTIWYSASFVKNHLMRYGGILTKIGAMIVL